MLPPEITAALIHSGPGAASWIEASGVWQQLGIELEESLPSYASVLSSLADAWSGPSSMAMIQAVEPYLAWLRTTAQQCQQMASSAQAVAAAFESARRTVVVPPEVTANRTRLAQLLATNWLGTNLAAIAETEAQYEGMWVNNSAAMYRYQAASAQALDLPQFSSPPAIVNPAAAAAQQPVPCPLLPQPLRRLRPPGGLLDVGPQHPLRLRPKGGLVRTGQHLRVPVHRAADFPINLLSYLAQSTAAQALQSVGGEVGQGLSEGEAAISAAGADLAGALRAVGPAAPRRRWVSGFRWAS